MTPPAHEADARTRPGPELALLIALAAVLFLLSFGRRDLWSPDEPRYMEVGREMVRRGDYLVPHLNGKIYPDKPPMFFWLCAALYKAGVGYDSSRVVALLASLGTVLLTYSLGRRLLPGRGGLTAALTTLTAALFLATSKMGVIDPLLGFLTTAAIYCGLRAADARRGWLDCWWLGFYAAAAAAVLTKGPVGIIVPALVLLSCRFAIGRRNGWGGWVHLPGVLLFLGIIAAWLVPALVRGGQAYTDNILFHQNIGRVWHSYSHRHYFYYYLLNSTWIFLPWTLFFIPAVWSAVKGWRSGDLPARTGLAWFGAVLIFFSLMSGKRAGYLMPLMPAFGILMARYIALVARGAPLWPRLHKAFVSLTLGPIAVGLPLCIPAVFAVPKVISLIYPDEPSLVQHVATVMKGVLPWTIAAVVVGEIIIIAGWRALSRHKRHALLMPTLVAFIALLSVFADLALVPRGNQFKSGRNLVRAGRKYMDQADELFLYHKDFDGVYNLYTGRLRIPVLYKSEDLKNALARHDKVAVIAHEKHASEALGSPIAMGNIAATARVGHRRMLLITNWDTAGKGQRGKDVKPARPEKQG